MELNSMLTIKIEKNGRMYQFIIPNRSPYGEIVDTAFEVFLQVDAIRSQQMEKIKEEREKAKEENATKEVDAEIFNIQ